MAYIDFAELKRSVTILQVADLLELDLKKDGEGFRTECPHCQNGKRTLVINEDKQAWFCFTSNKGGDSISLVQHVKDIQVKDAALFIHSSLTVPPKMEASASTSNTDDHPFGKIAKSLQYDHPMLAIKGLSPEQATALGIGFKKTGALRGKVLVPLRDEHGVVIRCLGLTPEQFADSELAKEFELGTNVVSFPKKTA